MELVYLSNGQACYLKEKIGNKFVVNKIYEYDDEENGWQEIEDDNDILVETIFYSPPVAKIAKEVQDLNAMRAIELDAISELENKKRSLQRDIDQITKTQISNGKFIINRSELINAKTLALFIKDRIKPITLNSEERSFRGLKLNLQIKVYDGEESSWGYKLYDDYNNSSGDFLCQKYGILINPTEQEIEDTIIKRVNEFKFDDWEIKRTDDKYLTETMLAKKREIVAVENGKEKEKLQKYLEETQDKLSKL